MRACSKDDKSRDDSVGRGSFGPEAGGKEIGGVAVVEKSPPAASCELCWA